MKQHQYKEEKFIDFIPKALGKQHSWHTKKDTRYLNFPDLKYDREKRKRIQYAEG